MRMPNFSEESSVESLVSLDLALPILLKACEAETLQSVDCILHVYRRLIQT